ncbi:MAG: thioredoxin domain-containing protein [Flexistipes sinusarabici]|uniref:Thioredoxin domain-containing protein n=1 Tax=Flexistipes sinusarabici TaxID=2352 RepID=A0A5D0MII0_FLESI|nr:thioredoxin domain-containing protein [Flexistipes sinusarabici]TYB33487.1 MAG: thioredoxin domain-containing protein [Flexistipes sinusarabici]
MSQKLIKPKNNDSVKSEEHFRKIFGILKIRRLITIVLAAAFFASIAIANANASEFGKLKNTIENNFLQNLQKRGMSNIKLDVEILKQLEMPEGFYFVKVNINDEARGKKATDYIITNGTYLLPDVINISEGKSMKSNMAFLYDTYDVPTKGLSLIYGSKGAENVIVDISDFQCPYCRKAHDYIKEKVKGMDNVAIYVAHMPLKIHDKAVIYAKIFEACKIMGKNFSDELYSGKYDNMTKDKIIETFAEKSGNKKRFKELLDSEQVQQKLDRGKEIAGEMGVNSTPVLFFNGRKVEGYNTDLMDKGLELFKNNN